MPTLEKMEKERGIPHRIVPGPFPDRHLRDLHRETLVNIQDMRRFYRIARLPVVGPLACLFYDSYLAVVNKYYRIIRR